MTWKLLRSTTVISAIPFIIAVSISAPVTYAGSDDATTLCETNDVDGEVEQRLERPKNRGSFHEARQVTVLLGKEVVKDAEYFITSPLRLDAKSGLVVGGVLGSIGALALLDNDIRSLFQRNRDSARDDIADGLHTFGDATTAFIGNLALVGAGWLFREHETGSKLMRTAFVSLEAQLFAEGISGMTKFAVGRARPNEEQGSDSFEPFHEFDRSFPSSHAARSFAVAAVFADRYEQPVPLIAYTLATLISLSRIYQDEHFASDVLAGAALGFTLGKVLSWRHSDDHRRWSVLPFAANGKGGLGLTFTYTF